ncbi:MAG: hypothetical protein GY950_34260 [bacterium]|nr:hypothetical protein [bacterium]
MITISVNPKNINGVPVFLFLSLCLVFGFFACNPQYTEPDPAQSFNKIYDNSSSYGFIPVDIKQTGDNGYIILGMIEKHVPYLLRLDREGNYMWDTGGYEYLDKTYMDPIPNILIIEQGQREEYYFFCNEWWNTQGEGSRLIVLLKASDDQKELIPEDLPDGPLEAFENNRVFIPLHASNTTGTSILLIGADEDSGEVLAVRMKMDGSREAPYKRERYHNPCINLYTLNDKRLHLTGIIKTPGNDYGFFKTFVNDADGSGKYPTCFGLRILAPPGITPFEDNFQKEPFFLSIPYIAMQLDGSDWDGNQWSSLKFSGARIEESVVSFYVNYAITGVGKKNKGDQQPELNDSKWVYIEIMNVNDEPVVFFAGTTKNNQIVLYAYKRSSREPLQKKYFGEIQTYEASGLIGTQDRGLAVLGTTCVADQLNRICLFKLSEEELIDWLFGTPFGL